VRFAHISEYASDSVAGAGASGAAAGGKGAGGSGSAAGEGAAGSSGNAGGAGRGACGGMPGAGKGGRSGNGGAAGASALAALRRRRPMVNPTPSSHCAPSRFLSIERLNGQPSGNLSCPALQRKKDLFGFCDVDDVPR